MRVNHFSSAGWRILSCLFCLGLIIYLIYSRIPLSRRVNITTGKSGWVFRFANGSRLNTTFPLRKLYPVPLDSIPISSPFLLPKGTPLTEAPEQVNPRSLYRSTNIKHISYYDPNREQPTLMSTDFSSCAVSSCRMTRDLVSADAVLFVAVKLKRTDAPTFKRNPKQMWIFKTDEAPSRFSWFENLERTGIRETMNWTMTHKLDSDIPTPYGKLYERQFVPVKDYDAIYNSKTKIAAWFVSHCPVRSRRKLYVNRMRSRINVDIFGKCGDMLCGISQKMPGMTKMRRRADNETCFPMLSSTYKFYLAFENSLCQEYITEKFFKLFTDVDVVPVVRGGADYKSYFPKDVLVDAADFTNPEDLADYLLDLAQDKERYIQYLKNKDRYHLAPGVTDWQCELCRKLHTEKGRKTYENIHAWYIQNSCHDAMDSLFMF